MDKLIFRLFLVGVLSVGAFFYAFPWSSYGINMPFTGSDYRLGLDLQGWIELDYKVDLDEVKKSSDYNTTKENSILEGLKSIVDKRVENLKINDSVITTASYGGEKHIIVQIPLKWGSKEEDELNIKRAKEAIGKVMKIEFKQKRTQVTPEDLAQRKTLARELLTEAKSSKYDFSVTQSKYKDNHENVTIGTYSGSIESLKTFLPADITQLKLGYQEDVITWTGIDAKLQVPTSDKGYYVLDIISQNDKQISFDYAYVSSQPSEWVAAVDSKGRILNDKYFLNSSVQYNQAFQPMIELSFNDEGKEIFGELTQKLIGQQIAIFVGGEMLTAPNVNEPILWGKAVITGNYTPESAQKLSNDINTGVVPAPIYLTSEKAIDSRLGMNSLQELIFAGVIGFAIIVLFLLVTYKMSGMVSAVALAIYIVLLLSIVKMFGIVLTLAGIAGILLSVGMAIDANILIFERVKDEIRRGHSLSKAVVDGFDRSWSAIWDSNVTWLIIAVILYVFGVNLIKGFGLMLGIGIVLSMFSAMFLTRLFLLLLIKKEKVSYKCFIGYKGK